MFIVSFFETFRLRVLDSLLLKDNISVTCSIVQGT